MTAGSCHKQTFPTAQVWRNGLITIVVAAVINAVLYFIGAALGWLPETVLTPMGVPVTIVAVVASTVVALVGRDDRLLDSEPVHWQPQPLVYDRCRGPAGGVVHVAAHAARHADHDDSSAEAMHLVAAAAAIYFLRRSQG